MMIDSEFYTHIKSWVYIPFAGAFSLLTSFFLWLRVSDKADARQDRIDIKLLLKENTASINEIKVDLGVIKTRIDGL